MIEQYFLLNIVDEQYILLNLTLLTIHVFSTATDEIFTYVFIVKNKISEMIQSFAFSKTTYTISVA